MEAWREDLYSDELYHHGVLGQKWGVRNYQNKDGSLTSAGKRRYAKDEYKSSKAKAKKEWRKAADSYAKGNTKVDIDKAADRYNAKVKSAKDKYKAQKKEINKPSNDRYWEKTKTNTKIKKIGIGAKVAGTILNSMGQKTYNQYKNNSTSGKTALMNGLGITGKALNRIGNTAILGSSVKQYYDYRKNYWK